MGSRGVLPRLVAVGTPRSPPAATRARGGRRRRRLRTPLPRRLLCGLLRCCRVGVCLDLSHCRRFARKEGGGLRKMPVHGGHRAAARAACCCGGGERRLAEQYVHGAIQSLDSGTQRLFLLPGRGDTSSITCFVRPIQSRG